VDGTKPAAAQSNSKAGRGEAMRPTAQLVYRADSVRSGPVCAAPTSRGRRGGRKVASGSEDGEGADDDGGRGGGGQVPPPPQRHAPR
jgi:hypothetical protein